MKKKFFNKELEIDITSFIDKKLIVWFKAKEVAQILGYKNTDDAVKRHVSENHKKPLLFSCPRDSRGQVDSCPRESRPQVQDESCPRESRPQVQGRWIIFIDEAGFYELVFKSKLPAAKVFREWVFTKVLPSIRKYGYFSKIDLRIKQRVIVDGKKYYKHPVFSNYAANKNGVVVNVKTGKKRTMSINNSGYLFFSIYHNELEKPKIYTQHRFVFEVLRGPIPRCFEIDHINNNKTDNRIKNLRLVTHKQNVRKRYSSQQ